MTLEKNIPGIPNHFFKKKKISDFIQAKKLC